MPSRTKGFTLIELVCVIVILGILAAAAIPKFISLSKEARIAKVYAMAAAVHSAAQLWNAVCLLEPSSTCLTNTGAPVKVTRNGITAGFVAGYPSAGNGFNGYDMDILVNTVGYSLVRYMDGKVSFLVHGARDTGNCGVGYCINSRNMDVPNCGVDHGSYRVIALTSGCS